MLQALLALVLTADGGTPVDLQLMVEAFIAARDPSQVWVRRKQIPVLREASESAAGDEKKLLEAMAVVLETEPIEGFWRFDIGGTGVEAHWQRERKVAVRLDDAVLTQKTATFMRQVVERHSMSGKFYGLLAKALINARASSPEIVEALERCVRNRSGGWLRPRSARAIWWG